uniref:Alpha-type protein kinase domain-containing protein n=1 Tax=Panagrolaimus superbus TaxID=310955 RepID=A0A914Z546_9BILA
MGDDVSWMNETVEDKPSAWTHEKKVTIKSSRNPEMVQLRETNKRLRTIFEESGLSYGKDVEESDLPERLRTAMALRKKSVGAVFENIKKARNVELCFLVDITGSMQPHIDGVKNSISKIVDSLKSPSLTSKQQEKTAKLLRCAFVAYRDHTDTKQFEILKFTESVETFRSFCAGLHASGGGDTPEDVFGGIEAALELPWSGQCGTKVIFHIADAPCHGKKYHDRDDSYPMGDPKGRTETNLFKQITENGIDYYFGKINNSTDKMIKIFGEVYNQEITEFDIKNVTAITESVISAVSTSVLSGIKESTMIALPRTKRTYTLVKDAPNWSLIQKMEGRFLNYEMPESIEDIVNDVPLQRKHPKKAIVQVAEKPFAHGAERYAFYGRDITYASSENIVLKEYLHIGPGMNSAARYEITNQIQTIASFFAQEFTKNDKNEFIRFTNNTDYGMLEETARKKGIDVDFVKILMAFSHWTYQESKKQVMVVDLQGIINHSDGKTTVILTDPAIHCTDKTRFGRMNLGEQGMDNFFTRHQCNPFCKALGLTVIRPKFDD